MILSLIQNIALLISLASIYRVLIARLNQKAFLFPVLTGLLFGAVGILGMMMPLHMMPGVIYDGRSIILSVAGLFGGPLVAMIAAILCSIYRLMLGGGGAWVGVSVCISSAAIGVGLYYLRQRSVVRMSIPVLWLFGLLVHIIMLCLQLALPNRAGLVVWQNIALPIIILFPIASVLVCLLFLDSETQMHDRMAVLESEKALKKAQQLAKVGSWIWYVQEERLEWSDEMYRIYGIEKDEFNGKISSFIQAVHPDDRARVEHAILSAESIKKIASLEYRVLWPDGSERIVWDETGELILDKKGSPMIITGIVQDITERRDAEIEFLESESRYRSLILNSPDAIFVNHDDRVVLANNACLKLFGAQKEEQLLGKTPYELFHPDDHDKVRQRIRYLRDQNKSTPVVEEKIIRLDGQTVTVDALAAPFSFRGSKDIHVILRDVTERKQMEAALIESHEMLTRLTEQVPGVVYQYRLYPDGRSCFPYASPGMEEIYEVKPEEVREDATPVFGMLHPEDYDAIVDAIQESARTLELFGIEFRVVLPRQGLRWRISRAKPERTEDGGTLWYGIISDITDRKNAEIQINEQLKELRQWRSVMINREKRTIELKKEVNELLLLAGKPIRYPAEE